MAFRNLIMIMIVFCQILFAIFGLAAIFYDADTYFGYAVAFFLFGSAYCGAVLLLAFHHDTVPRGRLLLRWMFFCALVPTALFCWALGVMAFG